MNAETKSQINYYERQIEIFKEKINELEKRGSVSKNVPKKKLESLSKKHNKLFPKRNGEVVSKKIKTKISAMEIEIDYVFQGMDLENPKICWISTEERMINEAELTIIPKIRNYLENKKTKQKELRDFEKQTLKLQKTYIEEYNSILEKYKIKPEILTDYLICNNKY